MSALEDAQALLSKDWSTQFSASTRLSEISAQSSDDLEEAAEFLFSRIDELILAIDHHQWRRDCFKSALGVLNQHVPFGWDSFVAQQITELHSKQRDIRYQSVAVLVSIMSGSREMRYPNLEREPIWIELIACLEHKDKHLRRRIAESLVYGVLCTTPQKGIVHFEMCESYVKKALIFVFDSSKCCIVEKRYIRRSSVSQSLRPCEKSYLGHELRHIDRDVSKGMLSETVLGGKSVDAVSTVQTSKGAANR